MTTLEQKLQQAIEANFPGQLTSQQLWTLVKLCKHVRLRCRNNNAFNNCFNSLFGSYARFTTVTKQRPSRYNSSVMESYPGLSITVNGTTDNDATTEEGEE